MALGEDVSSVESALKLAGVSLNEGLRPQQQMAMRSHCPSTDLKPVEQRSSHLDGGSRLAQGSAADLDSLNQGAGIFKGRSGMMQQDSMRQDGSSSKRKRVDSRSDTETQTEYALRGGESDISRSRDQMPPPPIPVQQPFAYMAGTPSSDIHSLSSQHDHVNTKHFQRAPITPQQRHSQGGLSRLMPAPGSAMQPFNSTSAGASTNKGQSNVDHRQSPCANTGIAGPVYARGGWQPPPESFDTERSGNHSSPSSSLPSTGQPPPRRSSSYHHGSLMFPIDLGDRTVDPSSRSYQSVSSDGSSSYHRRQSALAMQSQLESPAHSHSHNPSPNREGRITLSRTPSSASRHFSDKGIGLFSHVRSSSRQTNHLSATSGSHRQQPVICTPAHERAFASAHFPTPQPAYSSSLPSRGRPNTGVFRHNNSFDSGPTPVNGEMRPYSSTNGENILLAQDPRAAHIRGGAHLVEPQGLGPRRRANR